MIVVSVCRAAPDFAQVCKIFIDHVPFKDLLKQVPLLPDPKVLFDRIVDQDWSDSK